MGVSALMSHAAGKKHSDIAASRASYSAHFFQTKKTESNNDHNNANQKTSTISSMLIPTSASRAEILWVIKVIKSHYSMRLCLELSELFKVMFSDSEIAKSFTLSKTKCSYFINYALAPHSKEELMKCVNILRNFI